MHSLSASERNYAQLEKEALALIFGIKKFHQYLFGRKFTLITDHKPLMTILGPKKTLPQLAVARLQWWALLLSAYDYQLEFRSSQNYSNADGLSRLPLKTEKPVTYSSEPTIFNIGQIESLPVFAHTVQTATRKDPMLTRYFTSQGMGGHQNSLRSYSHSTQDRMSLQLNKIVCCGEFE